MRCIISSVTEAVEYDDLRSIVLPTISGQAEIVAGHAEYFTNLLPGEIVLKTPDAKEIKVPTTKSLCHVLDDVVTILD